MKYRWTFDRPDFVYNSCFLGSFIINNLVTRIKEIQKKVTEIVIIGDLNTYKQTDP